MIWLGIGLFFGLHLIPSFPDTRDRLVGRLGEKGYKGAFSILSLTGLVVIAIGYSRMGHPELWPTPVWASHMALAVMPLVFILWVAAQLKGHIRKAVKHPMMIGILLWAIIHLINNGDRASLYLFGSFALYSVYSIISSSRRGKLPADTPAKGLHDVIAAVVGLAAFSGVLWAHGFLFGVTPTF